MNITFTSSRLGAGSRLWRVPVSLLLVCGIPAGPAVLGETLYTVRQR